MGEKMIICKLRRGLRRNQICKHFDLRLIASPGIVRNKFLLLKAPSVFCYSSLSKLIQIHFQNMTIMLWLEIRILNDILPGLESTFHFLLVLWICLCFTCLCFSFMFWKVNITVVCVLCRVKNINKLYMRIVPVT